MNINKMLAVAAIAIGVGAYAAAPEAVWDGDFTTLTKGKITLDVNGNTKTDTYIQISGDNGVLVTSTDDLNVFTVLVRCEGLNLASANNQVLFTSYGAEAPTAAGINDNMTGVNLPAQNAVCRGIWQAADWNNGATQGSVPAKYTTLIYNHQQTNGTYAYALGPTSDSDDTVVRTTLYSVVGLRSSGTTYKGFAIGGLRGTTSETLLPATGLKITGIAVFSGTLTEAEMTGYKWPLFVTLGYEDFGKTAGVVLWRGTQDNFHNSTVIDMDRNGNRGEPYAMTADNSTSSWQRFASNQPAYISPGMVLVYDSVGVGDGYKPSSDAGFGPLSFGGMWVKTLAAGDQPFSIVGNNADQRLTEFGASGESTLFRFDASYTISRTGTTTFYGDATVEIAEFATFTAQANSSYNVVVDSAATLRLKGAGTLAVTTMNVAGTLDLSAMAVPDITGNVTLEGGATLVFPAGTELNKSTTKQICSGTLTSDGVINVKVGDSEPEEAILRISGGTIIMIETEFARDRVFTADYPNMVPAGFNYTYKATEEVTIPNVVVKGTLKTEGSITIEDLEIVNGASFEVVAGNTTVGGSAVCKLKGNITVKAGATLTNTRTDSLSYNDAMTVDIYGTLAMGTTRWSIPSGCVFNLHAGSAVTGQGDEYASLDFVSGASRGLDVYGGEGEGIVTVEGKLRVRVNESRIWIADNTTLVLESGIVDGGGHQGGFKQVGAGTLEIHANTAVLSGNASVMTAGTVRLVDTSLAFPIELQGSSALEIVATDSITTVPVDVVTANDNITFSGGGKADGKIKKTTAPGGALATFLQSEKWEGSFVADWEGARGTRFDINSCGNANSTVEVTKLAGGWVSDGSKDDFVVVPTVNVSGTMILNNGFSGKSTTLTRLTGSGTFTSQTYTINVTTLDNFTGTLQPQVSMTIGAINLTSEPQIGDKVVKLGSGASVTISATKVSVNGVVDDSLGLEVKDDGIYIADPSVVAEHVARVGDGDYYDSFVEALWWAEEGDTITLLADAELDDTIVIDCDVTIAGDRGISGGVLQIEGDTTLTLSGLLNVTSEIEFVGDGAALIVGPGVTGVSKDNMSFAEDFYGAITSEQNSPQAGWTTYTAATVMTEVEVTAGDATVTGVETGSYACGTTIEFTVTANEGFTLASVTANGIAVAPAGGIYSVTVGEEKISIVVTTAVAPKMIEVTVTAENATVTKAGTSEALESGSYAQGSKLEFTVTANGNYTIVSVTANDEDVVPAEGIYSVTVGEEAIEIVVTVEEESQSSDTYEITDETVLDENGAFEVPDDTTKIMLGEYDVTEGFEINDTTTPWTATLKKPELEETTAGSGNQFIVGDDNTVTLNVALVKGLYYGVGASASLTIDRPAPLTQHTGETGVAPLTAHKPDGASGFFRVFVDIKP